jgi:arabinofuranosyltransferase
MLRRHIFGLVSLITLVAHVGYYTFIIGGDHFEYRVYSHLPLLLLLSSVWLASRVTSRPLVVGACIGFSILASWPIPWVHWHGTRGLESRAETYTLIHPIANRFPAYLRPPVEAWDRWQEWLIEHHVCTRHQEHKLFYEHQIALWPSREDGSRFRWEERAVLAQGMVGVPGWVLPGVAIIDIYGLNDWVVARNRVKGTHDRQMGHDRSPPPGYVECFRPNVRLGPHGLEVRERRVPLTDRQIQVCEERDWLGH